MDSDTRESIRKSQQFRIFVLLSFLGMYIVRGNPVFAQETADSIITGICVIMMITTIIHTAYQRKL